MLALYRKYRPKSLKDVIGQDQVTIPLGSALKANKISHSYLFTGPRGCGKTSVARILAHEINGFKYELEDSYLDIIEIDAASNTGVDNIRDLREKAMIAPSEGKFKVYIIDEVHMLSKSAFNALLKTLEEPPAHVVFILATTDLEKVPVTITSRSQVFTFHLADKETMLSHLRKICEKEEIKITDPGLKLIIEKGGGSFRDSLSLLDQISTLSKGEEELDEATVANCLGLPMESKICQLLKSYGEDNQKEVLETLKQLLLEGLKPESIASSCLSKIIENPSRTLLPLLMRLPKVSAPYSEAKLLLAFLEETPNNGKNVFLLNSSTTIMATAQANDETTKDDRKPLLQPEKKVSQAAQAVAIATNSSNKKDQIKPSENSPKKQETSLVANSVALTPALRQQLKKCKIVESENLIDVYPPKRIIKTILERPANRSILKSNFDKEFIIHDPEDYEKPPLVSKISDIMGGAQEVNNEDGGIPF